jgi:O-antigen ligase
MKRTWIFRVFFVLVVAVLFTPLILSRELLFPYITTRAFYLRILVELALPFYLYLVIAKKELRPSFKNPLHIFMLLFLFFTVAAAYSGVNVTRSLWGNFERMGGAYYTAHLVALYFYVVLIGQVGGGYIKKFLIWAIGVAGVVSFEAVLLKIGVLSSAIGLSYLREQGSFTLFSSAPDPSMPYRASVTLGNPIFLASLLIIPFFLALYFGLQEEGWGKRTWYFLAAFFQLVAIVLSGTRGAIVGLVAGVFVGAIIYLIVHRNDRSGRYGLGAVGVFLVIVGMLFYFHKDLPQGTTLYRLFNLKDSNSSARLIQWKSAITGFPEHPLLGVGPENYYVISNKYYDPKIYLYDPSWFDKPHNYLLEILVTTGVFGFVSYAGLLVLTFWALWRAYRAQFFSTLEFSLLVAAVLTYQVQNLFVFDTISASLMFYTLTGFAGFLWHESSVVEPSKEKKPEKTKYVASSDSFAFAASGVLLVFMVYVAYLTNIVPAVAARNINYGYAYGGSGQSYSAQGKMDLAAEQYKIATTYLTDLENSPFNFDLSESGSRYGDYAIGLAQSVYGAQNPAMTKEAMSSALEYEQRAVERSSNDPIVLQKLANLYLIKSVSVDKVGVDPHSEQYVNKAMEFAPNRLEPHLFLAQVKEQENDLAGAEKELIWIRDHYPTARVGQWQLANLYYLNGRVPEALAEYDKNVQNGILPQSYGDVQWVVKYYAEKKEYGKAEKVLTDLMQTDKSDIALYVDLAKIYAAEGKKDEAVSLATQIMKADPSKAPEMQAIIDSFK